MQNCPSCQMLMEDHEALCPSCAQARDAAPTLLGAPSFVSPSTGPGGTATAVLERPVAAPVPGEIRYRQPGEHRRAWTIGVLLAVVLGGFFTVLFLLTAGACGAYVYALRQRHLRSLERAVKVRPLRVAASAPQPVLALRRSAN